MTMAPGGVTPSSTRVMNLSHFLTQAARRNPHDIGFVWRERQWTWREMEARVNAMAAALRGGALQAHRASGELAYHILDVMHAVETASRTERHVTIASACERPAPLDEVEIASRK